MPYEAELSDEMEVLMDDPILIECVFQDGWATGWNYRSQRRGAFPLESVIPLPPHLVQQGRASLDAQSIRSVVDELRNERGWTPSVGSGTASIDKWILKKLQVCLERGSRWNGLE
ncbi:hypothetical protein BC829DRAFT_210417 [Chytridium lagenaria]|nr:hypothetical protein BC829DRAFT_210417 [Chytridium lagenaria]